MKKILNFMLIITLVLSLVIPSYASPNVKNEAKLEKEIKKLVEKYGFEIVDIDKNADVMEVKNLKELEYQLKELIKIEEEGYDVTVDTQNGANTDTSMIMPMGAISPNYQDVHHFKWYNPFAGFDGLTLFCWSNVLIDYTFRFVDGHPQFVSLDSVDSYLTGITITWWGQKSYSKSITKIYHPNDKLSISVYGRYVLGVSIGGLTLGMSRNSTWKVSLILV